MVTVAFLTLAAAAAAAAPTQPADLFANVASHCPTTIRLPGPTGPSPVGTSVFHFVDGARPEAGTANPNDRRQVAFQLWYPAAATPAPPVAYVPELEIMRTAFTADPRDVPQKIARDLAGYACIGTHGRADAPAAAGGKFPVLVFSPGGNMSRHWHTAQAEDLASHGYVVVVLSHALSGLDVFPGLPVMAPERWALPDHASEEQEAALDNAMSDELSLDARFALDRVADITSGATAHALNGRIDLARVAIAGHSRGGKTVARTCADDARFKACVTYDNIAPEREQGTGLKAPQLTVRAPWPAARRQALRDYLGKNPSFAADVEIRDATHFTFTDMPMVDSDNYREKLAPPAGLRLANDITRRFVGDVFAGRDLDLSDFAADPRVAVWQKAGMRTPVKD